MKKKWTIRIGIAVIILLLIPFPYTVVPEWRLQLVYSDGQPAGGKQVYQMWTDSSGGMSFWMPMESLTTDEEGFVTFPKRTNYSPLLLRGLGSMMSYIDFWSHASYGRVSHLSVSGSYPSLTFRPGLLLENKWVIRPNSELDDANENKSGLGLPVSR